jgi:succinate dehydrogenase/fumarate reductase flavoprotein subunit
MAGGYHVIVIGGGLGGLIARIGTRTLLGFLCETAPFDLAVLRYVRPLGSADRDWVQALFHVAVAEMDDTAR